MDLSIHVLEGEAGSEGGNLGKTVGDKRKDVRGCTRVVAETAAVFRTGISLQNMLVWGRREAREREREREIERERERGEEGT